ncbi:hypothetical protein DPMN_164758 [Dreissena polymorpha]|uniref:Uncharacterized protein n=1 Tax=Dreissena polymorpha TaxID=45954 RepID=A0A9D4ISM6_DREPO|nr:hypothetical protein DPMN_164758 [Dreissena polymorpha]
MPTSAQGSVQSKQSTGVGAKLSTVQPPATKPPLATITATQSVLTTKPPGEPCRESLDVGHGKTVELPPATTTVPFRTTKPPREPYKGSLDVEQPSAFTELMRPTVTGINCFN